MKSRNAIKAGQCYTFPVKEIRKEFARSLYIVEVEGSECAVTQYPCQYNDPKPERLSCLVQDIRDGVLSVAVGGNDVFVWIMLCNIAEADL